MEAGRWERKIAQKSSLQSPVLHYEPQTKSAKFKLATRRKKPESKRERPKDCKIDF